MAEEQKINLSWCGYALDTCLANGAQFYLTSEVDVAVRDKRIFIGRDFYPLPSS